MPKSPKKKEPASDTRSTEAANPRPASKKKSKIVGRGNGVRPAARPKRARSPKKRSSSKEPHIQSEAAVLDRLWEIIERRRTADPVVSHSARLLGRGTAQVAKKFGEEAVECLIEILAGNRTAAIAESADVLYHLLVMWVEAGIRPDEVWHELGKREGVSNLAEGPRGPLKRLIKSVRLETSKIP